MCVLALGHLVASTFVIARPIPEAPPGGEKSVPRPHFRLHVSHTSDNDADVSGRL